MSNSVKVALIVCITVLSISIVAALVSIQLTGGDEGILVRNLGLIASFLVTGIPVLITSIRTKERTDALNNKADIISKKTADIEMHVNGNLQEAVVQGTTQGVVQAVQMIRGQDAAQKAVEGGQEHGESGSIQGGQV